VRRCVVIPARYGSSRYPGKPLVPLLGKPMILWVAELSARAVGAEHTYVATEDERIADVVRAAGYTPLMTSSTALTGTDRLAEAARQIDYDVYINVQGDEPLIDPADIRAVAERKAQDPSVIVNGFCWMGADEDPASVNIPKVVAAEDGTMIYMSRLPVPGFKDPARRPARYAKQVCIYAFTREELEDYAGYGRKGAAEACEDIEILRFAELGRKIVMVETRPGSLAVDVPEDVAPVEAALRRSQSKNEPLE
jgi:3-deoxy-manno-octulosonate cytidylyltransferase (CMP-KDO synthetase)